MARPKDITGWVRHRCRRDWCPYCGKNLTPSNSSIDHIHPQASSGPNIWYNYTGACKLCNNHKNHKSLLEFLLVGKKGQRIIAPVAVISLEVLSEMPKDWYYPLATLGYRR